MRNVTLGRVRATVVSKNMQHEMSWKSVQWEPSSMRTDGWMDGHSHDEANRRSLQFFRTRLKSICCFAHINTIFRPVPNVLQQRPFSFAIAVPVRAFKLFSVIGTGRTETPSFEKPYRKKSRGLDMEMVDGGCRPSAEPSFRRLPVKTVVTSLWICVGVLSYSVSACNSEQFHDQCLQSLNSQLYWRLGEKRGTFLTRIECEKKYILCGCYCITNIFFNSSHHL
jgi:hypothetical protein